MVSAADFNHRKQQLADRYEAAGGDPHDLEGFAEGVTWERQLQVLQEKVEEQERKSQ